MTSTLTCKIVPDGTIPENALATFDAQGSLLLTEISPGYVLPDSFQVEIEEGVVLSVVKGPEGFMIDEDDQDVFVAMVFG